MNSPNLQITAPYSYLNNESIPNDWLKIISNSFINWKCYKQLFPNKFLIRPFIWIADNKEMAIAWAKSMLSSLIT